MNKNITQFIETVVNDYNNFPLIDYDEIAQTFVNKYIDYANKIKSVYEISNWLIDEHILINDFWDKIIAITNHQDKYDLICQIIIDYYSFTAKHIDSIYQTIDMNDYINVDNSKHLFYVINFFESNKLISREALNNIELFFFLYNETANFNLLNRLKTRYIYPLTDAINEYLISNIIIQDKKEII